MVKLLSKDYKRLLDKKHFKPRRMPPKPLDKIILETEEIFVLVYTKEK